MIIYGQNCLLRNFNLDDVKTFYAIAHDESVKRFVPYAYSEDEYEAFENVSIYSNGDMKNDFYFVIEVDQKVVGAIISVRTEGKTLDTSAFISKDFRKRGIMTDAMNAFIKWLKQNTDYYVLAMTIDTENDASNHQIKKIGGVFQLTKDNYNIYHVFVR